MSRCKQRIPDHTDHIDCGGDDERWGYCDKHARERLIVAEKEREVLLKTLDQLDSEIRGLQTPEDQEVSLILAWLQKEMPGSPVIVALKQRTYRGMKR